MPIVSWLFPFLLAVATNSISIETKSGSMGNGKTKKNLHLALPDSVVFPPDPEETGHQVVDRIYRSFGLTEKFPQPCLNQVDELMRRDPCADNYLKDFTNLPFITIDNDNSQDLDQAMWICKADPPIVGTKPHRHEQAQGYLVSYALADGAYFVPAFSPLFQHALKNSGSSYYLPGKAVPMLPRTLSEDLMSLNPNVKRRALVFDIYLNESGHVLKTFYVWGVIRSRWQGTYREVTDHYHAVDSNITSPLAGQEFTETLDLLREVGLLRRKLAAERDVVDYKREKSDIAIDKKGNLRLVTRKRYSSELYNEQISLLCNTEGAKLLAFLDGLEDISGNDVLHPIYRTQGAPRDDQLYTLRAVIENTLKAHKLNETVWAWHANESIASYLRRIRGHLDSLNAESSDFPMWANVVQVIERQAMITNVAASFTADPSEGHHSLKMSYYARFSAPMRELVGCYTHKGLFEAQNGNYSQSQLTQESDIVRK